MHYSRLRRRWTLLVTIWLLASSAIAGDGLSTQQVEARLLSELRKVQPGSSFWVGLHLKLAPGWHTYWRNPGDSGLAPRIQWQLPAGVVAGEIRWPAPQRFRFDSLMSYGYSDEVVLLTRLSVPPTYPADTPLQIQAAARWLVCERVCIPERGTLALTLPVTQGPSEFHPQRQALLAHFAREVPRDSIAVQQLVLSPDQVQFTVLRQQLNMAPLASVSFFPVKPGVIEHGAAQKWTEIGNLLQIELVRGPDQQFAGLEGVLSLQGQDGGEQVYLVRATQE